MCIKSWRYLRFRDAHQTKNVNNKVSKPETLEAQIKANFVTGMEGALKDIIVVSVSISEKKGQKGIW